MKDLRVLYFLALLAKSVCFCSESCTTSFNQPSPATGIFPFSAVAAVQRQLRAVGGLKIKTPKATPLTLEMFL